MTVDPLLNPVDFAKFQAKDQDWFLGAVGDTIRDYCGWHIAPEISVTDVPAIIGNHGIIMLPTLNLVSIEGFRLNGAELSPEVWQAYSGGYIEYYGYAGRRARGHEVWVDMTHGFTELPKAVAEVGYELTGRVLEKPAGIVTDMQRGPTRMTFGEFGVVLSDDQKNRLGPYRVMRV
jgi:hypothetical protein